MHNRWLPGEASQQVGSLPFKSNDREPEVRVKELLKLLATFDPNAEVILQKDAEGNGYSPLAQADQDAVYVPDSSWSGHVYSTDWSAADACMDKADWDHMLKRPRCVVLAPVN
jgi:hypothetical protein